MEKVHQIAPMLHVPDPHGAVAFFRDSPGCGLRLLAEPARKPNHDGKARMTVYIDVAGVDALHARLAPRPADWLNFCMPAPQR